MKNNSAIRRIHDPAEIPLSDKYIELSKKLSKLTERFLSGKDRQDIDAFDEIITASCELALEETTLNYVEGFKLGLALGYESAISGK